MNEHTGDSSARGHRTHAAGAWIAVWILAACSGTSTGGGAYGSGGAASGGRPALLSREDPRATPLVSETVDRAGGRLEIRSGRFAGLALDVPPESVAAPTVFSITATEDLEPLPGDSSFAVGPAVEIEPHGVHFEKPVTLTLPLDFTARGDADHPSLVLQQAGERRTIHYPPAVTQSGAGRVEIQVQEFSTFQPVQRPLAEMLMQATDRANCTDATGLAQLGWNPYIYYFQGAAVNVTAGLRQRATGVDMVFDLYHRQFGTFWYDAAGLYSDLLSGGGSAYMGVARGNRPNVQAAWSGNFVSASVGIDIVNALSGFFGLGAGVQGFTSCRQGDDLVCDEDEVQWPGPEAVYGGSVYLSAGLNGLPEFGAGLVNGGGAAGWWSSHRELNAMVSSYLTLLRISHHQVEVATPPPALSETATYLEFDSPDGSAFGASVEMARAMAALVVPFNPSLAAGSMLLALAQDAGCDGSAACLEQYCGDETSGGTGGNSASPGTGATPATGGAPTTGSGGAPATASGGTVPQSGGSTNVGTGAGTAVSTGGVPAACSYGDTGDHGDPCVVSPETWRCVYSAVQATHVSQVCRDGVWQTYHLDPSDCTACCGGFSSACEQSACVDCEDPDPGTGGCGAGDTGNHGDPCSGPEETWRCVFSSVQGVNVSQVCRDGIWQTYHRNPSSCGDCCGEYTAACAQ